MRRVLAHLILLFHTTGGVAPATTPPTATASAPPHPPGIVVETIRQGSTGDLAGVLPGDLLLSWVRDPSPPANPRGASGTFTLPFDLTEVFVEQLPRGRVTLSGRRGAETKTWTLPAGSPSAWSELQTAPALAGELATLYEQGRAAQAEGQLDAATAAWRAAARAAGPGPHAAWLEIRAARALAEARRWQETDELFESAVQTLERAGENAAAAQVLRELGSVLRDHYEWDWAKQSFRRARDLDRRRAAPLAEAASLIGLADAVAVSEGADPAVFFRQALALQQRIAPGSSEMAETWQAWANAAGERDPVAARRYQRRAVALQERVAGPGLYRAKRLLILSRLEFDGGRIDAAALLCRRALELLAAVPLGDVLVVTGRQGLANIAARRGDFVGAVAELGPSLAAIHRLEPGSFDEAGVAYDLGSFERGARQWTASAQHICHAVDLVRSLRQKYRRDEEILSRWGAYFADYYRACAGALVRIGQPERAFEIQEEGRARAFLHGFERRGLRSSPLPAQLSLRQRQLGAQSRRIATLLSQLEPTPANSPRIAALDGQLQEIRRKRERLLAETLAFRSLSDPEPLTWRQARDTLDPGTVLLAYSVGAEETQLFVLSSAWPVDARPVVFSLPVGAKELARRARALVLPAGGRRQVSGAAARALYELLVQPAEPFLAAGERILIVADGPLHLLPFAALKRRSGFLIEWKPIHYALSVTTYGEIRKARRPASPAAGRGTLVAFGDPVYPPLQSPGGGLTDGTLRSAIRGGLPRLPESRREVEEIVRLFPGARAFLGAEATKAQVFKASRGARILHFAVHGLLQERRPLHSALALSFESSTAGEGGVLEAWEIMDELKLDADLVTLSACDTALGPEVGGEGLLGLTRAFLMSGTRSVLATLRGIPDRSTSELMQVFYRKLRSGATKDRALQAAQIHLIRSARWSAPKDWAAFQLSGDWK